MLRVEPVPPTVITEPGASVSWEAGVPLPNRQARRPRLLSLLLLLLVPPPPSLPATSLPASHPASLPASLPA